MVNVKNILAKCDHTLLAQTSTWEQIKKNCDDGMKYQTASVCIPPSFVKQAKEYVGENLKICTVIGFPNGYNTTAVKVFETQDAVANGADEIDMVANIGLIKQGEYDQVRDEIKKIKQACGGKLLKVIIETCLLTDDEKVKMCQIVSQAGAEYIKTSTGFSTAGATFEDVKLMVENGMDITMVGCYFDEHERMTYDAMGMGVLHWALGDRTKPCELDIYTFTRLTE